MTSWAVIKKCAQRYKGRYFFQRFSTGGSVVITFILSGITGFNELDSCMHWLV